MFLKFVLAVLVLSLILPKTSQYIKWIVSAGLAQVSEFSFVLGSRARRAGIISREVSCATVIKLQFLHLNNLLGFGITVYLNCQYAPILWHLSTVNR